MSHKFTMDWNFIIQIAGIIFIAGMVYANHQNLNEKLDRIDSDNQKQKVLIMDNAKDIIENTKDIEICKNNDITNNVAITELNDTLKKLNDSNNYNQNHSKINDYI